MSQSTPNRTGLCVRIAAVIIVLGLLAYAIKKHGMTAAKENPVRTVERNGLQTDKLPVAAANIQPSSTNAPEQVLKIQPDDFLATVNGHALKALDVLPTSASNQVVSLEACEYFLQRAVDRELIFQTAKAQGIALDQSQEQQILDFKTVRGQSGPGLVRKLNGDGADQSLELQDAEAFMLQTSLMEKSGASPNVTADQVSAYYQQHASDFGGLPTDEPARSDAWRSIDFEIREKLSSQTRSDFQNRLTAYMNQLKSQAEIQFTPLTSFVTQ